jgi:hypothetical protein
MKNKKLIFAGMLCLSMAFSGCGSKTEEKKEEPAVEQTEEKQGEAFTFTNSTKKTITSFVIREAGEEKYGDNLLEKDVEDGKKAEIYPEAKADTKYDIQFTADGKTYTIEALPLDQMEAAQLIVEGDEAYVTYTDKDGNQVSTKKEEVNEEAEVSDEAAFEAPAETYDQSYAEPVYDTPVYDDGGAAAPADDGCLSGISDSDLN